MNSLLPYLWESMYKDSIIVVGGYTYPILMDELLDIPNKKRTDAINFCIKHKIFLSSISNIFKTISTLNEIGTDFADNRYDRYYKKVFDYKLTLEKEVKKFETMCTNPKVLQPILEAIRNEADMLIPLSKPSTMIYEAIRGNDKIFKNRSDFLNLFGMVQSNENKKLTAMMNFKNELWDKSGLLLK